MSATPLVLPQTEMTDTAVASPRTSLNDKSVGNPPPPSVLEDGKFGQKKSGPGLQKFSYNCTSATNYGNVTLLMTSTVF